MFVVRVFGYTVLEIITESPSSLDGVPSLEATSGGQFEMGFSTLRDGEVTCRSRQSRMTNDESNGGAKRQ